MGCYDGAKVYELVGGFVLDKLSEKSRKGYLGHYQDDGLGSSSFRNTSARLANQSRKKIVSVFAELGLRITIQVNLNNDRFSERYPEFVNQKVLSVSQAEGQTNVHPQTIQSSPNYNQEPTSILQ